MAPSKPQSGLTLLPQEILDSILDHLHTADYSHDNEIYFGSAVSLSDPSWGIFPLRKDLLALSLTCRQLWRKTRHRLYHSIGWTWNEPSDPPLHLLLRSILNDPELGSYIHHLRFDSWNMYMLDNKAHGISSTFTESELERLKEILTKLQVPSPDKWVARLLAGCIDTSTAILISQLGNLQSLDLVVDYSENRHNPDSLWSMAKLVLHSYPSPGPLAFKSMRRFKYFAKRYDDSQPIPAPGTYDTDLQQLLPMFSMPTLEELALSILDIAVFTWGDIAPPQTRITSLTLNTSRVSNLGPILEACPRLEGALLHT